MDESVLRHKHGKTERNTFKKIAYFIQIEILQLNHECLTALDALRRLEASRLSKHSNNEYEKLVKYRSKLLV